MVEISPPHLSNLCCPLKIKISAMHHQSTAKNVDRLILDDLVQIVPALQSFIDQNATSSYTRRGSMIYTKKPSRESVSNKMNEAKGQNDHGKNRMENGGIEQVGANAVKEREDLREKVEDLQKQLLDKDEILKSVEGLKSQTDCVRSVLDQVKKQVLEKDALLRSTQAQIADVKVQLADKQASIEKLQWETMTFNKKVDKLQEDLNAIQGETASYNQLFDGLSNDNYTLSHKDCYDVTPHCGHLPEIDDMDEMEMSKMEEAQEAYLAAIAALKNKQDDQSITIAANARLLLQSLVL